jgi:cell division protein FtsW
MRSNRADTSTIGKWWWGVDHYAMSGLGVLIGIGYMLAFAASPGLSAHITDPHMLEMLRQIFFLGLAGVTMVGMSMLSLRNVKLSALGMGIVFYMLTAFTLVHGTEVDGANRWLALPGFTIQPSEFLRPAFIIIMAWLIAEARRTPGFPGKRVALGVFLATVMLLKMQPDIGMTFLFTMVVLLQFYLDGMDMKWVLVFAALVAVGGAYAVTFIPHVHERWEMYWNLKVGSQAWTALSAFGNGGVSGLGPGDGEVKHWLPDARADFVFAVVGEEFGLFLCTFIIFTFAFIVLRALLRLLSEPNLFVVLAAGGLAVGFGLQAFVNMASSLTLIPTKGMTLPFLSYGGSSALAVAIQMGFLLALTRKRHAGDPA